MFTTRPTLQGTFGMVSSTHWLASQCAMAVLEDGGNAFDAAVAAGFVLHVVEPHLNGPAGEVPIILAPAGESPAVLCGQGPVPAGASVAHYTSLGLDLVPGTGPLAAAVPGAFDAWMLLLRDHGTRGVRDVLRYAIHYAESGHPAVDRIRATVESVRELFEQEWTSSAELYLPGGRAPRGGELLRNPALAETWRRVIAEAEAAGSDRETQIEAARRTWREGFVAEALVRASDRPTMDTSGERHTGTLSGDDLAAFRAGYEAPVTVDWNGWTLCKAGPWSQGPALLQQLALLPDDFGTGETAYGTAGYVHTLVEGTKLAMADREAWYGDAADVPLDALLSPAYNAARRKLIGGEASLELRPGSPDGRTPRLPAHVERQLSELAKSGTEEGFDALGTLPSGAGEPTVARDGLTRATPATSTSSTAGGTWSPPRPAAAGSSPTPSSRSWASRSAPACRWRGSNQACPTRSRPAAARAPRSPRRWRCGTASRSWPSAPPAATNRTSGACTSSSRSRCARRSAASGTCRARSTPPTGTPTPSRVRSSPVVCGRAAW